MKNYFSFNLTGRKLLPVWILFLLCFIAPYTALVVSMQNIQPGNILLYLFFPLFLMLMIIAFVLIFYIIKLAIENVSFKDKTIVFTGTFSEYFKVFLFGFFISMITFGIYLAWFIRDIHRFFINNSSYESQYFKFQGKGGKLFVILLLTMMLPIFILTVIMTSYAIKNGSPIPYGMIIPQAFMMILMIPYLYFIYKWMINIDYKTYNISWETNVWKSCGKIAVEIILSVITVGIYTPLAMLRLYKYFADRTVAASSDRKYKFGYDIDQLNDFLFLWGQALLTIITLGIYYPWAICKTGSRISGKTYLLTED
jgi:uncharacterized membrane protein YjgN (DUF898 family)